MDGEDGGGARRRRARDAGAGTPRLEDVARLARVSTATVSRVLNRPSAVTPELRKSVQQAVENLGYVPHGAARALASRRSNTIGAVIPTVDNAIFASSVQALQACLYDAGLTLLLASSDYDYERERRQVQSLIERGIDGLIMVGERRDGSVYELLEMKQIPFVNTWIYDDASPHPCIGFDNRRAAHQVASYVLDIGHRRVAMVAGITVGNDRAAERVEGVRAALAERGASLAPGHLLEHAYEYAEGRRAASQLLATRPRPTAIVCGNDILALGVLFECRARGLEVPGDVSITGFDDLELAANVDPPLTTMRVPATEMGRRAAEYLLSRLNDMPAPDKVELDVTLIVRASTSPPCPPA